MASLHDIPEILIDLAARQAFKDWLTLLQIDPSAKRRLIRVWADVLDAPFTEEEYLEVGAND
jgi:hypothetical protein